MLPLFFWDFFLQVCHEGTENMWRRKGEKGKLGSGLQIRQDRMFQDASDQEGQPVAAGWHAIVLASNPQVELSDFKTRQVPFKSLIKFRRIMAVRQWRIAEVASTTSRWGLLSSTFNFWRFTHEWLGQILHWNSCMCPKIHARADCRYNKLMLRATTPCTILQDSMAKNMRHWENLQVRRERERVRERERDRDKMSSRLVTLEWSRIVYPFH